MAYVFVSCAWDFARIGTATINWTDDAGAHSASFSSGRYAHPDLGVVTTFGPGSASLDVGVTDMWITALVAAMNAATTETVTGTRNADGGYTLSCTGATFSLTFSGDAGTRMRQLIGMTGNRSSALTYTSQCTPKYLIIPQHAARTNYTGVLQVSDVVRQWTTDSGAIGALAPTTVPHVARWEHHFESEARTFLRFADSDSTAAGHQYTWESLAEDAWMQGEICAIEDSASANDSLAFYLRSSPVGDSLRRVRPEMTKYVVRVDAHVMGKLI